MNFVVREVTPLFHSLLSFMSTFLVQVSARSPCQRRTPGSVLLFLKFRNAH